MKLFVDTSALIALADFGDANHGPAAEYVRGLPTTVRLVTTDYIFDETVARLRFSLGHPKTVEFGEKLMTSRVFSLVAVNAETRQLAWELFRSYRDKRFSYTDCTSFVIMKVLRLEVALAFDRHFLQAGFRIVPQTSTP